MRDGRYWVWTIAGLLLAVAVVLSSSNELRTVVGMRLWSDSMISSYMHQYPDAAAVRLGRPVPVVDISAKHAIASLESGRSLATEDRLGIAGTFLVPIEVDGQTESGAVLIWWGPICWWTDAPGNGGVASEYAAAESRLSGAGAASESAASTAIVAIRLKKGGPDEWWLAVGNRGSESYYCLGPFWGLRSGDASGAVDLPEPGVVYESSDLTRRLEAAASASK